MKKRMLGEYGAESLLCSSGIFLIRGFLISCGAGVFLMFLFSIVCRTLYASESLVFAFSAAAIFSASLVFGLFSSRTVGKRGIVCGVLSGTAVFALIFLVKIILIKGAAVSLKTLIVFALSVLGGAFGGIFGVNSKKTSHRR